MDVEAEYKKLGFRCGIEIHRQLATDRKLFCNCVNDKSEDFPFKMSRNLRAVAGELGTIDRAALHEMMRGKNFVYSYEPRTACLVELDEEPPRGVNMDALKIALTISSLINLRVVDEMHVMRKTVVDGSSVSGFQRTALLGYGGHIKTGEGRVGITNLSIEEDSAPKVSEENETVHYRLDRLGVPLVEIGTDTDIVSPEHCMEVAQKIGMILKSTGKVKRGIGTIRQDINVSIKDGARVEIKGAQDLRMIPEIVRLEVERQKTLVQIRDELRGMKFAACKGDVVDVTDIFSKSESKIVRDKNVYAVNIQGIAGFFKRKLHAERTLGNEVANYARVKAPVKGVIHTDENIEEYKLSAEFEALRGRMSAGGKDLLVIVAAGKDASYAALNAVVGRVNQLIIGVPEETRRALANGDSEYMRPLPGSSRMYPETDVMPVVIERAMIDEVLSNLPETLEEKQERFTRELWLNKELSLQIVNSDHLDIFEKCVSLHGADPKIAANVFVNVLPDLRTRENIDVDVIRDDVFFEMFDILKSGKITKDVIPVILKYASDSRETVSEIVKSKGLFMMSEDDVRAAIRDIVAKNKNKGAQMKEVIGECMGALRGKIDNKRIVEIINEEMKR